MLGPILFIMYTADVTRIVERHGLNVQRYADDTQLYGVCHPSNSALLCRDLGDGMNSVASWMSANRLQLNAAKTEFMWCVLNGDTPASNRPADSRLRLSRTSRQCPRPWRPS